MDHHKHMHMHVHTQETKASPQMIIKSVSFQKKDWLKESDGRSLKACCKVGHNEHKTKGKGQKYMVRQTVFTNNLKCFAICYR